MTTQLPFFGREAELKLLHDALHAATDPAIRKPQIVTFVAETGVGKSRIIQEFYRQLTVSDTWDPCNFWPDAFQSHATQLLVNPEFPADYVPDGPPQFLWLGVRWTNTHDRNVANSLALPTLKEQVLKFSHRIKQFQSLWQRVLEDLIASGKEIASTEELLKIVAGNLVPFADVAISLFAPIVKPEGPPPTLPNQLFELFHAWFARTDTPIIFWLDDAQWIDKEATEFFTELMRTARAKRWPLLLIATSWPMEWNQFNNDFFLKHDTATTVVLSNAADAELRALLHAAFPHLPPDQVALIVHKTGGNFLNMIENISELHSKPDYFVDGSSTKPLSPKGITNIQKWESIRQKRIAQRFNEFDNAVQNFLARASQTGLNTQFLQRVLVRCRDIYANAAQVTALLTTCSESLAVIIPATTHLHEFRDRGYFAVAQQHFVDWLADNDTNVLQTALVAELTERVQSAFDNDGDLCDPQTHPTSLRAAPSREQFLILDLALRILTPNTPVHVRTLVALVEHSVNQYTWNKINTLVNIPLPQSNYSHFDCVNWKLHAGQHIGWHTMRTVADALCNIGALEKAERIYAIIVDYRQSQQDIQQTPYTLRDLSIDLVGLGRVLISQGHHPRADIFLNLALTHLQRLVDTYHAVDDLRNLAVILNDLGIFYQQRGNNTQALQHFTKSLTYTTQLLSMVNQTSDIHTLAITLTNVGHIYKEQGHLDTALTYYQQSLAAYQNTQTTQQNPDLLRNIAVSMNNIGIVHQLQHDYTQALACFAQSLQWCREIKAMRGTPNDIRELSATLNLIGRIYELQHNITNAHMYFQDSLEQCLQLKNLRSHLDDTRDLSIALAHMGRINSVLGDFPQALMYYQQNIELLHTLTRARSIPSDQYELAVALNTSARCYQSMGDFANALAYYHQSLVALRSLVSTHNTPVHTRELISTLQIIGTMLLNKQNSQDALPYFTEALQLAQTLSAIISNHISDDVMLVSAMHDFISKAYEMQHDTSSALFHAQQAYTNALQSQHRHFFSEDIMLYLEKHVQALEQKAS